YGYIKNHMKSVKNRQARTQESEEYKVEAKKVKPQSKSAKKSQKAEGNNETENKPIEKAEIEEVDKWWKFNDSLSRARAGKVMGKTYNVLPWGPVYEAILKKKITKKEDIRGNFKIPCSIGGLKHVNALVDQGSDVNVMPYSTYMKLTNKRPTETNIRLLLASHSYIYPLGIAEDILVEVTKHVYPVDFVILDIKENEKSPFILGTPFLTTAKAVIKFDKGVKNEIEPITPTMTVNRLVLEWEERIKFHLEKEMEFNQWRSKNFKGKHPTLIIAKRGMEDEGEVT
ncbi:zinc finger, CCHC-type containing protein, partial [Tanacetum coccineum]